MANEKSISDGTMEEMLLNMGKYMVDKLQERIESVKKRLEEVKKSGNKNKEEIEKKLIELIDVMNKVAEKTKVQTNIQKELIELTDKMARIDDEIDKLLLN